MRVAMPTVEVDDKLRRAIRYYYGKPGLATREEVRMWREQYGTSVDLDAIYEMDNTPAPPEGSGG